MKKHDIKGGPLVILHVEDEDAHAELVRRNFEDHRVSNSLHRVRDGQQALDYLRREGDYSSGQHERPNLVLLDLRLPRVDGLEVLKQIKSSDDLKSIPVVILTTSDAERDVARSYELHANSYLVKPINFLKFSELLDELGYYWLAWNSGPNY